MPGKTKTGEITKIPKNFVNITIEISTTPPKYDGMDLSTIEVVNVSILAYVYETDRPECLGYNEQ